MSKLTRTIITMNNLVSAGPGDWKELHDMALELEAKLEQACKNCGTYRATAFEEHAKAAELEAENGRLREALETIRDTGLKPIDEAYRRLAATTLAYRRLAATILENKS